MGRAKERKLAIANTGSDPGPDKEVPSYKQFRRSRGMEGPIKKVNFNVQYNKEGTNASVNMEGAIDPTTLIYIWVSLMQVLSTKIQGNEESKGLNFIKKVQEDFNREFSS